MTDTLTPEQRHHVMAAIHGKDTKPEKIVRQYLWHQGYRYRLNHPRLPGKPDIVLLKYRTCIFVNGCFWHGPRRLQVVCDAQKQHRILGKENPSQPNPRPQRERKAGTDGMALHHRVGMRPQARQTPRNTTIHRIHPQRLLSQRPHTQTNPHAYNFQHKLRPASTRRRRIRKQ